MHWNVTELMPEGTLAQGMAEQRIRGSSHSGVVLGRTKIPYAANMRDGRSLPQVVDGRLLNAQIAHQHGVLKFVGRGGWTSGILRVSTFHLDFSRSRSMHIPIPHAWPGAESETDPLVQIGVRSAADQHQLFVLLPKMRAIISDRKQRYVTVVWQNGVWSCRAAQATELAELLAARALRLHSAHRIGPGGLDWTRRALHALGAKHLWPDELAIALRACV